MSSVKIGSAKKRGRGRKDAIVSISGSSDGDNGAVIATTESKAGSSEAATEGLVVRRSKRAKPESTTSDTSDSITPSSSLSCSSSSSAGALSTEGALIVSNVQSLLSSLLGPVVSQLQSVSQQQIMQGQQLQQLQTLSTAVSTLSASHTSLSASVSSIEEDVAIIVKQVLPLTLVGGGLRSSNVLSVLYGAHSIGEGIFGFLDCKDGNNLRLVCHEMRTAVAAFPWNDKKTCIKGSLCSWRTCFPNAKAANFFQRRAPLLDADFRFFRGLHYLTVAFIKTFSDAAFSQLSSLKYLDIESCTQLTDAIFPHLVGLETLDMRSCSHTGITGTAFGPLRGSIQNIWTEGCREVVKAAARAIATQSMVRYLNKTAAALLFGGTHVLEDGRRMNESQLYLECLRLDPRYVKAYGNLACTAASAIERVSLPDGRSMNQRELYLEALRIDRRHIFSLEQLASTMTAKEKVTLPDNQVMTKKQLRIFAASLA